MNFSKGLPNNDIWKVLAELCTKKRIILSRTPFQNNFGELRTIMHLLLSPNDEDMVLLNPLTLGNLPTPRRSSRTREEEEGRLGVEGSRVVEGSRGRGSPRGRERFPSVKVLKKSMPSSLAGSNQGMLVRSSAKLFWNGVPDRIIRLLVRIQQRPSK